MEWQHCIAYSAVVIAPQSNAYAARATVSAASRMGLAKYIMN